jgi:hypothetical protein|tara:strand:- start:1457 stop:1693 length:237 start_codon:yes stop_codon:yes gene_type:complete
MEDNKQPEITPEQLAAIDAQMSREFAIIRVRAAAIELKRSKHESLTKLLDIGGLSDELTEKMKEECTKLAEGILNIAT